MPPWFLLWAEQLTLAKTGHSLYRAVGQTGLEFAAMVPLVEGEYVRDFSIDYDIETIFPYDIRSASVLPELQNNSGAIYGPTDAY